MRSRAEIEAILDPFEAYLHHRDGFAEAMDARFFTIEWLDEQVNSGAVKVWGTAGAAIIATLVSYPSGALTVEGIYAAGDLQEISRLIPFAEEWGQEMGATFAFISSREAWIRIEPSYSRYKYSIIKDLGNG